MAAVGLVEAQMQRSDSQASWEAIAMRFALTVRINQPIDLHGRQVIAPVLLEGFGAKHGMVIVTDFALIAAETDALVDAGYGFSCLNDPGELEESSLASMLRDWGWTGPGQPPAWYGS